MTTRQAEDDGDVSALVVGIGASAGGLEAMFEFFDAVPPEPGMTFVVVTHQHAGRPSLLPELLQRHSTMPVIAVADEEALSPNRVLVGAPGVAMTIQDGLLCARPDTGLPHLPIDAFFRSLGDARGSRAVGIVLSGTGSDGTLGLHAIGAAGGMTLAQSSESAEYAGMPRNAEVAGVVDHVAAPAQMPPILIRYLERLGQPGASGDAELDAVMQSVIGLLRRRRGHDFSHYKPSTLRRRLLRRVSVRGLAEPLNYLRLIEEDPDELELLFRELLIGVTSFFRDPEAFARLEAGLLELVAAKPEKESLRVWVAGCSTGEEAYSIAILLEEVTRTGGRPFHLQVFATDLDPRAVEVARGGTYSQGIAADITPERLERWFVEEDDRYRVKKELRETLVFAVQNLVHDPPFTRLDLLVCRNVLIYFDTSLQRQLLPLFQYALRPGGLLFLGSSETVGSSTEAFEPLDRKWKIFRRREGGPLLTRDPLQGALFPTRSRRSAGREPVRAADPEQLASLALLELLGPTLLVDSHGDIVHVHGRTGRYLEPSPGAPRMNIVAMARDGLRVSLSALIRECASSPDEVVRSAVSFQENGGEGAVNLRGRRVAQPEALRGLIAITFEDAHARKYGEPELPLDQTEREAELERELASSRETLQSTIEELETMNEELKSTNEELQSTNEELQSTNEELETSREEMQSLNEELQTVNQELQNKIEELSAANDDIRNLLDGTKIATIFLDRELRIQRFTPEAKRVVSLIDSDVGRPLADLVAKLDYEDLEGDARATLEELAPRSREVQGTNGSRYLARMGPYQTADNKVDGVVLTFVDISAVREAEVRIS